MGVELVPSGVFVFYPLLEFGDVLGIFEGDCHTWLAVPTCPTCFLVITLEVGGEVEVEDKTDVGFVDAHAEGVGGGDNTQGVVDPS